MPASQLTTLGGFAFNIEGSCVRAPATRKARALMSYLILHKDTDASRERLLETFWPDAEPERARDSLKTALWSIRQCLRAVGVDANVFMLANKTTVRWTGETEADATRFVELASRADAGKEALTLYRGDFLEGDYDNWVVAERERLSALFERLLAREAKTARDPQAAEALVARNPFDEDAYVVLIEAEERAGNRTAAAIWAARCVGALAELGEQPSAGFRSRFQKLLDTAAAGSAASQSTTNRTAVVLPPRNNLPLQLTSFIGRTAQVAEIKSLLDTARLVTLVGTGGVGKTRVALRVASDLLARYPDGVWFVDLAKINGTDYVAAEIASVLGQPSRGEEAFLDQIVSWLRSKSVLLILDNCEHVAGEVAKLVAAVLRGCPQVTVFATSRQRLSLQGEHVYLLPSLELPPADGGLPAGKALQFESVDLFVQRARAANSRFVASDDNAPMIGAICRRLGGIALAVELAAARVGGLTLAQLSQRLDGQFRLLTSDDRTALPRQQTMRATIDWSYDLLPAQEQKLFRELAIFRGGWTIDSVSVVCQDDPREEFGLLDKLSSLVEKSLVAVELRADDERYRLLEPLRQYGLERLEQHNESETSARRHAEFFMQFANAAAKRWRFTPERAWLAQIEEEIDNIRAALDWTLAQKKDVVLGGRLIERLWSFWWERHYHEGMRWIKIAQASVRADLEPALSISLDLALSRFLVMSAASETQSTVERALRNAHKLGDERLVRRAIYYFGELSLFQNQLDDAAPALEEALTLAERSGDPHSIASRLYSLGMLSRRRGNLKKARELIERALTLFDPVHERNRMLALLELACVERKEGNLERAAELAIQSVGRPAQVNESVDPMIGGILLAFYLLEAGRLEEAVISARSGFRWIRQERLMTGIPSSAKIVVAIFIRMGEFERAARLLGCADKLSERGDFWASFVELDRDMLVKRLRAELTEPRLVELLAEGASWSEERALEEGVTI